MCFVLEGSCIHRFGGTSIKLKELEFADLPEGEYLFEVTGESEVRLVLVWDLSTLRQLAQKVGLEDRHARSSAILPPVEDADASAK